MKKILGFLLLMGLHSAVQAVESKLEMLPVLAPDIRHGQLANGLKYFIKPNAVPAGKVELRLLVNVGAMSEAEDERGVAHLLEHMAFRRTKHFGPGALKAFLESQGMRLGGDMNAFTFHEWTNYQLSVSQEVLPQALQLLADWANGIELDAAELELEREVVLDEGRLRQASSLFYQSLYKMIYPKNQYHTRLPIGDVDVVKKIPLEKIKAFYQREYQAQKMTLLIAGDIKPQEAEEKVQALFAGIAKGTTPIAYTQPERVSGLRFFSHRDVQGIAHPQVGWGWILPAESLTDVEAAYSNFKRGMLGELLQQRLAIQASKADSPIIAAQVLNSPGVSLPTAQTEFNFSVSVKDARMKDALQVLYRELERAKRFGFSQEELNRGFEKRQQSMTTHPNNAEWMHRLQMHAQFNKAARNPAEIAQQLKIYIAATTPAVLQDELKRLLLLPDQVATILLPPAVSSYSIFFDKTAQNIVDEVRAEAMDNQAVAVSHKPLLTTLPVAGKIVSEKTDPTTGGLLMTLSNGLEVLMVPPKTGMERIGFSARAKGGMAALPKPLRPAGFALVQYLSQVGVGAFSGGELRQMLPSQLALQPIIQVDLHGFAGEVAADDLETLLQLQYLAWTTPRDDEATAKLTMDMAYQAHRSSSNTLYMELNEKHYGALWPYPRYWQPYHFEASVAELSEARKALFGNPRAFRFVLTGLADKIKNRALIEQYLASLPTQTVIDFKPEPLAHGRGNETHQRLSQPYAMRLWHAYVPMEANSGSNAVADFLSQLLQQRLWQALRENTGETYGVYSDYELTAQQGLLLKVQYQTDIKQCDQSAKITASEIARLRKEAPTLAEMQSVRTNLLKFQKERINQPMQYAKALSWYWLMDGSLAGSAPDFAHFTPDYIHQYAKDWLGQSYWAVGNFNCSNTADLAVLAGD